MTTELWLLRHGQSEGNQHGLRQGQQDYPLTAIGRRQISALAAHWDELELQFDLIISSPLTRALDSARLIGDRLNVDIEVDNRWQERNAGDAEGTPLSARPTIDGHNEDQSVYEPIFAGGESNLQLHARASEALQLLLSKGPGRYLVVSHGGILNGALHVILGLAPAAYARLPRFSFANSGYAILRLDAERRQWQIEKLNITNHLNPETHRVR